MKRLLSLLAIAAAAVSCVININGVGVPVPGNGVSAEKNIDVKDFTGITVAGATDVIYVQDLLETSVVLRTDENLLDLYEIEAVDGNLRIAPVKGKTPMPKTDVVVTVHSPAINSVVINGSGDLSIPSTLAIPEDFSFKVNGSGDCKANLVMCRSFEAAVSGSGDIEVESLTAGTTTIRINGSGDADLGCNAAGDIDVRINGSGDVKLHGLARSLTTKINGSGDVNSGGLRLTGI